MHLPSSTSVGLETPGEGRIAVRRRRVVLVALFAFVLAGLTGLLGVRSDTTLTEQEGWTLAVEHATVARAGLDVPWQVTVEHPGGLGRELTLAVTGDYFDLYETQGFFPEPAEQTRDGETLYLTFTPPPGDRMVVAYDAYVQPSAQLGRSGTVSVVVDGRRVAPVGFHTTLFP